MVKNTFSSQSDEDKNAEGLSVFLYVLLECDDGDDGDDDDDTLPTIHIPDLSCIAELVVWSL